MALGDPYATLAKLKSYLSITDTVDDAEATDALDSVSREIEQFTKRQFNKQVTATARLFGREAILRGVAWVDDFHTITDLVIATDDGDDGAYSEVWTSSEFELEPLNGIVNGETGWPFYRIRPLNGQRFPTWVDRAPLRVTAQWGWNAVPAPVRQACLILASETLKLKDAPFGVAGFGDMGVVRVRDNPMAAKKLMSYVLDAVRMA